MVNTTSQVGLRGLSGSSPSPNSDLLQSVTLSVEVYSPSSQIRCSHPGARPQLRWSSSPRLRGHRVSSRWNLCVCNTFSNPSHPGSNIGLSSDVDFLLVASISAIRRLTPDLRLTVQNRKDLRRWICQTQVTAYPLIWSPTCFYALRLSAEGCSHVEAPEQLSLAV
jgi:hypothetical protein